MKYLRIVQTALVRFFPVITAMMLGSASILYAASDIPYSFSPGQNISSAQVNANFQALLTKIQALEAQLAPASIIGTYDFVTFGTGMFALPPGDSPQSGTPYGVVRNSYRGTLAFGPPYQTYENGVLVTVRDVVINGTGEYTSTQLDPYNSADAVPHGDRWYITTDTEPISATSHYTISGSTVAFANAIGTLSSDGKLLVFKDKSANTTGIIIGTRR